MQVWHLKFRSQNSAQNRAQDLKPRRPRACELTRGEIKISCRELAVKFKISRGRAQCHVSLRDSKFHVERTVKLICRSRSRSPHDLKFALAPRHAPP
nr:hypothetical protein [uncultured Campylobacter sp.]